MPEIDVGVPDVEVSVSFPVADAGTYPTRITKCEPGQSQQNKPKLVFHYTNTEPVSGQRKNDNGDYVPETIPPGKMNFVQSVSLAQNALFSLKAVQLACGGAGWSGKKVRTEEFVGKIVRVKVSVGEKDGKKFNSVDDVLKA